MSPLETSTASRPLQRALSSHTTHSLPCWEGDTPLNLAINRKKSDVVAYLQRIGARGQPNIHKAAASGNAGLVRDHIVADPAAVHAKEINFLGRYVVCLCLFFQNYSMNPVSIVPSNFPLHPY
jgi:hypothetical protein